MKRVAIFVDGFNTQNETIVDILYFTSYVTWDAQKLARHQIYVKALQLVGVKPVFGAFRMKDATCRVCYKTYKIPEEKQTDVNIAIKLFETAVKDIWDTALIISGDSDLIPAIEAIKKTFPAKQIHLQTCQFDDVIIIDKVTQLKRPASWV